MGLDQLDFSLLDRRFIHILNIVVLKMAESLQDRPEFYNSTRGAVIKVKLFYSILFPFSVIRSTTSYRWCKQSRLSFLDACALHYFGKLLSFSHYLIFRPNFDEFSTKFRQMSIRQVVFRRKFDE